MKGVKYAKENGTTAGHDLGERSLREIIFELSKSMRANKILTLRHTWRSISVSWQVQELIEEYASLIKAHFAKLLNCIQQNNWRTNPNILVGARVAVFRKSATLIPIVVTG
jgi:hypothetical protein